MTLRLTLQFAAFLLAAALFIEPAAAARTAKSGGKARAAKAGKEAAPPADPSATFTRDLPDPPGPGTLPPDYVMVRVDDHAISARDFVSSYFRAYAADRPGQDSLGRVEFMKSLIHRELLGREARRINKPLTFEDRHELREHTASVYSNILYRRVVLDRVQVTDEEVASAYELFKTEARLRHILVPGRELADKLRRDLLAGRIGWTTAVQRHSIADKANDGDLGWQSAGTIGLAYATITHRLQPGQISTPIRTRDGWDLVQCMERRDVRAPAFEGLRNLIRGQLETAEANLYADALQDSMSVQLGMAADTMNIRWAAGHFRSTQSFENNTLSIDASLPEFSPADTGRVLVRWRDGQLSLGSFLHEYGHLPPMLRPAVNEPGLLRAQAIATALTPYTVELAVARGIDRDPAAVRQVEEKREGLLVQHLYRDSVEAHVSVSIEAMRRLYEQNRHQYVGFPEVRFAAITRSSRAGMDSVVARIRAGESPADILRADSLAGYISGSVQERRMNEQGSPYHRLLFEELRPGQFSVEGPDPAGDFMVLHLLERREGKQFTFEESRDWLEESLANEQAERLLHELLARLASRHRIQWRPDLVMRTDFRDES